MKNFEAGKTVNMNMNRKLHNITLVSQLFEPVVRT